MACGDNEVSRDGLPSGPAYPGHPTLQAIWLVDKGRNADLYTASRGVFEAQDDEPLRFDYRESGYQALAEAVLGPAKSPNDGGRWERQKMGEKSYAHWTARLVDGPAGRDWLVERLVRAPGVAGKINRRRGY